MRRAVAILAVLGLPVSAAAHDTEGLTTALAVREALDGLSAVPASVDPEDWPADDWDWVDQAEGEPPGERKSLGKAVMASAILPGMGERYVGYSTRANVFLAVEAAVWTGFILYRIQGDQRADRYEEFANLNAGAPRDGDRDYYEHIGFWLSLEEWHDIVRRDARLRFPDDPASQEAFFQQNKRYDAGDFWEWPDDATRTRYRQLRSQSERSYRNSRLFVGAAVVNRLVSMIDALALARRHNHALDEERARLNLRIGPQRTAEGLSVGPVLTARY